MKPRRSILSVPGHVEKMHHKAAESDADVIMLDLEDSVPLTEKKGARRIVSDSLKFIDWHNKLLSVRINALDTEFAYRDLLEIAETSGNVIDTIVVPKVSTAGDIHFVSRMLDGIELNSRFENPIGIEPSIENAEGVENISSIARASRRNRALVFGIADYSASIGARLVSISGHGEHEEDIYPGYRWNYVISKMVNAAKSNGLLAIDAAYGNFKDSEGLRKSARISCALGCDGKWAIHPSQAGIINEVFSPTTEEIERALKIIEAHNKAVQEGRGAVSIEGRMVDHATVRMALNLRDIALQLGLITNHTI